MDEMLAICIDIDIWRERASKEANCRVARDGLNMGLIEIASNNSFWRGVDYYNSKKVLTWEKCGESSYRGIVSGSNNERYEVFVNKLNPRKSTCTCPFAADKRVICKHMLAVYFTAEPQYLKEYLEEIEEYEKQLEEEEECRQVEHERELMNKAKSMTKSELVEEVVLAWLRIEDYEREDYY